MKMKNKKQHVIRLIQPLRKTDWKNEEKKSRTVYL